MKILPTLLAASLALAPIGVSFAQKPATQIKTRLDHFNGTPFVLVINYLPSEIVAITCETWTMLGTKSWKDHNNFTIPSANSAGPAIGVMNADKFDGYCAKPNSIIAHTDDGDFVGHLDAGDGNWNASTKLVFKP